MIESKKTKEDIAHYTKIFARFPDAYKALKWILERDCEVVGIPQDVYEGGESTFFYPQEGKDQIPTIMVLFMYDSESVYIISLSARHD